MANIDIIAFQNTLASVYQTLVWKVNRGKPTCEDNLVFHVFFVAILRIVVSFLVVSRNL